MRTHTTARRSHTHAANRVPVAAGRALDRFGASAPSEDVMQQLGFTAERVTAAALGLLGREAEAVREEADDAEQGDTAVGPTAPTEGHS